MASISLKRLQDYRHGTFRSDGVRRVDSLDEAVRFVDERGFIFFGPIKDLVFPNLWSAVAGDRPVADEHDDPGHVTWGWKDSLLGKKRLYYARVLRRRNAMISLETAPYFYSLSENFGSPEEDYLYQYERGALTQEAKSVYEALLREGPLDTIALRRIAHLASRDNHGRFGKALDDLQIDFKILPTGISDAGSWHYSFIYDLTARHFPELIDQARFIQENAARDHLTSLFFSSLGAAKPTELNRAFGWTAETAAGVIDRLVQAGSLCKDVELEGSPATVLSIPEMINT
ncbi:MAG TPA: crosslink repair DNA glycosylase YcaQ family protein [Anaerolineaceae bacterium]